MSHPPRGGATAFAADPATSLEPSSAAEADVGQRGRLTIADRVVEKVAAHAISQVDHAAGAARRVLGLNVGEAREDSDARVRARVDGSLATIAVALTVRWPASVPEVTADARRRIRDDVQRITAVQVRQVDIDVVGMTTAGRNRPRVR